MEKKGRGEDRSGNGGLIFSQIKYQTMPGFLLSHQASQVSFSIKVVDGKSEFLSKTWRGHRSSLCFRKAHVYMLK